MSNKQDTQPQPYQPGILKPGAQVDLATANRLASMSRGQGLSSSPNTASARALEREVERARRDVGEMLSAARAEAGAIVKDAREQAAAIMAEARAQAKAVRAQANAEAEAVVALARTESASKADA